jgi:hypothetical protein
MVLFLPSAFYVLYWSEDLFLCQSPDSLCFEVRYLVPSVVFVCVCACAGDDLPVSHTQFGFCVHGWFATLFSAWNCVSDGKRQVQDMFTVASLIIEEA